MPRRYLIVIEAPGKIATFQKNLGNLIPLEVFATNGHFFANPQELLPMNITRGWNEPLRVPRSDVVSKLVELAGQTEEVIIATDPDAEGEVIARDVYGVIAHLPISVSRMYCNGLNFESLQKAFQEREQGVKKETWDFRASLGDARRVIDRAMGAVAAQFLNINAGRVSSQLLATLQHKKLQDGLLILALDSSDGAYPFYTRVAVSREEAEYLLAESTGIKARAECAVNGPAPTPLTYGESLVQWSTEAKLSPLQTADIMQDLYSCGLMSYPRGTAPVFDPLVLSVAQKLVQKGLSRKIENKALFIPIAGQKEHPSPSILSVNVPLLEALAMLSPEERVLQLSGRNLLESSCSATWQYLQDGLPSPLKRLIWRRSLAPLPWERKITSQFYPWSKELALVNHMVHEGIGRSSTLVRHAQNFIAQGNLDSGGNLTRSALSTLQRIPSEWQSSILTKTIDSAQATFKSTLANTWLALAGRKTVKQFDQLATQLEQSLNISEISKNPSSDYNSI